jgi:hypothetical protein
LMGVRRSRGVFCLIDFGLSHHCRDPRTGQHIQPGAGKTPTAPRNVRASMRRRAFPMHSQSCVKKWEDADCGDIRRPLHTRGLRLRLLLRPDRRHKTGQVPQGLLSQRPTSGSAPMPSGSPGRTATPVPRAAHSAAIRRISTHEAAHITATVGRSVFSRAAFPSLRDMGTLARDAEPATFCLQFAELKTNCHLNWTCARLG